MSRIGGPYPVADPLEAVEDEVQPERELALVLRARLLHMRRVLASSGQVVVVGLDPSRGNWIAPIARILGANLLSRFGRRRLGFMLTDIKREDLLYVKELIEAGEISPVIDRTYQLSEVPDAIRYLETMRARGKVIISV